MIRVQCMSSPSKRLICAGMLSPHNFPLDASKHRCLSVIVHIFDLM